MSAPARETVAHLLEWRNQQSMEGIAYYAEIDGEYQAVSVAENYARTRQIAMALWAMGVRRESRVAIISETRAEWARIDAAILSLGAITVGIYPTSTAEQIAYILNHSEAEVAFLEDRAQYEKIIPHLADLPQLKTIILIEADAEGTLSLEELYQQGEAFLAENPNQPTLCLDAVQPDDIATLVYTSGTTGPPKGVVLRHKNLYNIAKIITEFLGLNEDDVGMAFLPMAHILQRVNGYAAAYSGLLGYYLRDIYQLVEVCKIANPTLVSGVPRIFEKIHASVMAGVDQATPRRQKLFHTAITVGKQRARLLEQNRRIPFGLKLKHALYERLVYSKLRRAIFGERIKYLTSGAAPISLELLEFFHAIGMPIYEGYGLTETSSPITLNRPGEFRLGTVGRPLSGSAVKIAEDGEILLKGPGVFAEYYKDPAATTAAFTPDGFFKSGDIGEVDADGYLKVTDRKKNIIITAAGKNVAPANIEYLLMSHPYISQVMVYGDRRKYLVALITLDEAAITAWAAENEKGHLSYQALTQDPVVRSLISAAVEEANQSLARFETIKYFRILPEEVSVFAGTLTPTLKLKRRALEAQYSDLIEEMYEAGSKE